MAVHLSTCCTQHRLHLQRGNENEIQHDIECRHIRRQHLRRTTSVEYSTAAVVLWRSRFPAGGLQRAPSPPVVCFSRGCACNATGGGVGRPTCMMRHCRTKWTAFMGPIHSPRSPPPRGRGRARAQGGEGGGIARKGPGGEGEREGERASALNNVGF